MCKYIVEDEDRRQCRGVGTNEHVVIHALGTTENDDDDDEDDENDEDDKNDEDDEDDDDEQR